VHVLIFANPIAGRGKGRELAHTLQSALAQRGHTTQLLLQNPSAIEPKLLREASPEVALVIGGDGSIRAVADLLLRNFPPEQIPPILVVPLGTANLMAQHLHIDWPTRGFEQAIVGAAERRRTVDLDTARANGSLFLLMAGVGIDAAVVHGLARVRTGPIDYTSYVLPAAMALGAYSFPALRVTVDDREAFPTAPAMAFVGNVREYGTGFPILPHAQSTDHVLDVCVLPCNSRQQTIDLVLRAAAGEHLAVEGVVYTKGSRVVIESERSVPVQLDGDASGHTPVEIQLLPARTRFIVP